MLGEMSLLSAVAVYFVIWWIGLFAVLPFGIRTQAENGDVVPGTVASAPAKYSFVRVAFKNTIVAAVLFGLFYYVRYHSGLSIEDLVPSGMPDG